MSEYIPDCWVIVKITNDDKSHYRVFAGWYGGYLSGDSWKMNSGITAFRVKPQHIEFDGTSGSMYLCNKCAEKMSSYMMSVLASMQSNLEGPKNIKVVEFATFCKEFKVED